MRFNAFLISAFLASGFLVAAPAGAATITVNAADNIYGAGQGSAPGGGNVPGFIALSGATSLTFSSVTGSTDGRLRVFIRLHYRKRRDFERCRRKLRGDGHLF